MRAGLAFVLFGLGCATADGDISNAPYDASRVDSEVVEDSSPGDTTEKPTDTSAPPDTATSPDTAVGADTSVAPDTATSPDTGTTVDTGTIDTEPVDTGVVDTGTVADTTPPVCGPPDKYGPKCKTNLDCAAITGCGYVCCAFDPFLMTNLGCGRVSLGTTCLP